MTITTRRQIIASSLAAAGAAAVAPAMAAEDQDRAEWLALWHDYMRKEFALEEFAG